MFEQALQKMASAAFCDQHLKSNLDAKGGLKSNGSTDDFYTDSEDSDQTEWMRRLILIFNVKHFLNTLRWTLAEIHR